MRNYLSDISIEEIYKKAGVNPPLVERFWSKVTKKSNQECWNWTGVLTDKGYGYIQHNKIRYLCHRISWLLAYQKMPKLDLLHSCDNPICVNPKHLREGIQQENIEDMVNRNRQAKGEQAGSKLTKNNVINIRKLASKGLMYKDIAKIYNVDNSTISVIVNYKSWKHIL